jgi:hypothetical protein
VEVPEGFVPIENQGPFLDYVGPIHVREGDEELVFGPLRSTT